METIHFNFKTHLRKAARTYYLNALKIRLLLGFELILALFCILYSFPADSVMLRFIGFAVLFVMVLNYVGQVIIVPNKLLKGSNYEKDVLVSFDSNEMELKMENGSSKVNWHFFLKIWENQHYYFLFLNKKQYWILPKSAFQSSGQEKEFRRLLESHHKIAAGIIR